MNVVSTWVLKNSDKFPIVTIIFHPVGVRSQYLGIHIIPINYKFVYTNFHTQYITTPNHYMYVASTCVFT